MSDIQKFHKELQNLLVEFGVEPFVLVGFKGQEDFALFHSRGSCDLRSINDLFQEKYEEWYVPDEEVLFDSDMIWEDDNEGMV